MKTNKTMQAIVQMSKKSAIKNTGWFCRAFWHQPKVPAKLLAMKNAGK